MIATIYFTLMFSLLPVSPPFEQYPVTVTIPKKETKEEFCTPIYIKHKGMIALCVVGGKA